MKKTIKKLAAACLLACLLGAGALTAQTEEAMAATGCRIRFENASDYYGKTGIVIVKWDDMATGVGRFNLNSGVDTYYVGSGGVDVSKCTFQSVKVITDKGWESPFQIAYLYHAEMTFRFPNSPQEPTVHEHTPCKPE